MDSTEPLRPWARQPKTCTIDDCDKPTLSRGMCSQHYGRWRRHRDPRTFLPVRHDGCSVEDCSNEHKNSGYCAKHYSRWRRWGDPLGSRPVVPSEERFWSRVKKNGPMPAQAKAPGPCWEWTGTRRSNGYGAFKPTETTQQLAHRYAWELLRSPIPAGLVIDHLCRNRACVNPDHLEVVTLGENTRRGFGISTWNRLKTHCPQGHPYSVENTYIHPKGSRICRICIRETKRRSMQRIKERNQRSAA